MAGVLEEPGAEAEGAGEDVPAGGAEGVVDEGQGEERGDLPEVQAGDLGQRLAPAGGGCEADQAAEEQKRKAAHDQRITAAPGGAGGRAVRRGEVSGHHCRSDSDGFGQ